MNPVIEIASSIRVIPDYPIPGISFRDITTLLQDAKAFKQSIDYMAEHYRHYPIQKIVGVESRGFIFGAALAYALGVGFVPVRKKGKLPFQTITQDYVLEYGTDTIEMHIDAIAPGENVVVIDDLIATGGSATATCQLIEKMQGHIIGCGFIIHLKDLNGKERLEQAGYDVFSVCSF